ncbi:MAG: HAMP domain-containing histidine kinase [Clostridia bacterium]|nr:HAMP domain-containing histidine kinase [Clostridia bacterium]
MNNNEFSKLKNSIAIKCSIKIILYSIIVIVIFAIMIDGIYNDELANELANTNIYFYRWCVQNKTLLMGIIYLIIFISISFLVIRNSNKNMVEIIVAMDKIMKNPEQDVKLSNELIILENRLNKIRVNILTSKNKAKEEVQKRNDLLMYIAHDLKTPLTSVIGYLNLLEEENQISKNTQEKYINIALKKSLRLEELINQFFEITRYNLQEIPIIKNKIDLSILLDQLLDEFYPMLQEKNLKYIINKPKQIDFLGDGDKLARAFGNIIKNAINYSYESTDIEINVEQNEDVIKLKFRNKGDKIPDYKLDKLFEKFYRVDEARTATTGGTGLGLAITKQIIELHNGSISVKNDDDFIEFSVAFNK